MTESEAQPKIARKSLITKFADYLSIYPLVYGSKNRTAGWGGGGAVGEAVKPHNYLAKTRL